MRVANVKTRKETGLSYVMQNIYTATPFGMKLIREVEPFFPGQEAELEAEFDKMENVAKFISDKKRADLLYQSFMETKDCTYTLERSEKNTLSVVELFEIKCLLIIMEKVRNLLLDSEQEGLEEFIPEDLKELLDAIDPSGDRINTFYIYDEFSEKLGPLRKEKRECEIAIRKNKKSIKAYVEKTYGLEISPKFEIIISNAKKDKLEQAKQIPELIFKDQDYVNTTFEIKPTDEVLTMMSREEELNEEIEAVELEVREKLTEMVAKAKKTITLNCDRMGRLDFVMGKVTYAREHKCVRPEIAEEHMLSFEEGRNLELEDVLKTKLKEYCPVGMELTDGVTCITGANMGGKTISLKLAGQVQLLAQYGLFVPCKKARVGLSNFVQILIGDSQSIERGLSSFGSEIEELKEILDNSKERSLILIDEIASGTNPVEGLALTRSLIEYLIPKPYITLITTHFDNVAEKDKIKTMQVVGLENADFNRLDKEIKYANRKERINIISKYMDYRLKTVEREEEIPKDALNIAKILGLSDEIINRAKEFIK